MAKNVLDRVLYAGMIVQVPERGVAGMLLEMAGEIQKASAGLAF
jgi:hypothetical protein